MRRQMKDQDGARFCLINTVWMCARNEEYVGTEQLLSPISRLKSLSLFQNFRFIIIIFWNFYCMTTLFKSILNISMWLF